MRYMWHALPLTQSVGRFALKKRKVIMIINSFEIVSGKLIVRFVDLDGKEKRLKISAENVLKNWQAAQQGVQADGDTCTCKLPGFDVGNLAICPTCHKPHRM